MLQTRGPAALRLLSVRVSSDGIGARLFRGTIWSLTGAVLSRAAGVLSTILVARILGVEDYGTLGIVQASAGMFGVVGGFGMGLTATKFVAERRKKDPASAGRIIGLSSATAWITGMCATLIFLLSAEWLAVSTLKLPSLAGALRISSLLLILGSVNGAQTGALTGLEAFKRLAHINFASGLFSLVAVVSAAYLGGVVGAIWGAIACSAFQVILSFFALRVEASRAGIPLSYRGCHGEWRTLVSFSLPAVLSSLLVIPVNWICSAILVRQPGGLMQMGIANAANQWRMSILLIPDVAGRVVLPLLAHSHGGNDVSGYRRILKLSLVLNICVASSVALVVGVASPWIMAAYGPDFVGLHVVLWIIAAAAILVAANNVIGQSISSRGRMWTGMCFNAMWAVAQITATWLLAPKYGAVGLVIAVFIAYLFHTVWQSFYLRRLLQQSDHIETVQSTGGPDSTVMTTRKAEGLTR